MSVDRIARVNALLKREIGDLLFRVMDPSVFNLAAATVTRVETSKDLREARVYVSLNASGPDQARMLDQLERRRGELQRRINKDVTLKYTPRLRFVRDESVAAGDRVLAVLAELERNSP